MRDRVDDLYPLLFEATGCAMVVIDEDDIILKVNGEFERLTGYSREEVEGKLDWKETVHPGDIEMMRSYRRERIDGKGDPPQTYDFRLIDKEGRTNVVLTKVQILPGKGLMIASLKDITELRSEHRKRMESQHLFINFFHDTADGTFITDMNGKIIKMNRAAMDMFGYGENEMSSLSLEDLHADKRDWEGLNGRIAGNDSVKDIDVVLMKKSGKRIDCQITMGKIRDPDGAFSGMHGIIRDITARKEEKRKLMESEEKYRTIFMESPYGIYRTSSEGRIVVANPALVEMLGFDSPKDVADLDITSDIYFSAKERDEFTRLMERDLKVEGLVNTWRKKNGELIYVRENARAHTDKDGHIVHYDGMVTDITREKVAEEKTELNRSYFEGLFETAREGIIVVDRDSRVLRANREFVEMFGYSAEEVLGKPVDDIVDGTSLETETRKLTASVLDGKDISFETRRVKKDGSWMDVSILASPIIFNGEIIAAFGIYRDITRTRINEKKIRELNERLKEISRILRHDLMNNLTIILHASELTMEKEDLSRMDMIMSSVNNSINLIRKMKEYEDAISERPDARNYTISEMTEEVTKDMDIPVELNITNDFKVGMDFYTVINNLVMNSVKHGQAERIEIDCGVEKEGDMMIFRDDGNGMCDKMKEHSLEKGYKGSSSSGSGLGLFFVRSIIDRYGGKIEMRDNPGGGLVTRIWLPR